MKLVYIGDPHERISAPKNRTDDYFDTYNKKVEEIKELVRTHQAKALLQPGDFLDAPKFDNAFLMDVINRWSMVPTYDLLASLRKGEIDCDAVADAFKQDIPFIGAIGNHELFGDSIQSYPKTSLAFLERIGFMILPTKEKPFILTDDDGTTVAITSSHYHGKMDTDAYLSDYIVEEKAADFHIHMVHGYLTNRDMGDLFKHTTLDKIAHETKADLTISGHDHIGFPLTEVDGKWFINPGSMTRTKNDIKEMTRHPKALVVEVTKAKGVTVKEVPLKAAQKGADVLSRESIKQKQAKTAQMEEIKTIVSKAQVKQGTSIASIIKNIGEIENVDVDVVNDVVKLVTQKMEDMNPEQSSSVDPYTIKSLWLENFQGHQDTKMALSEGLNVIVGESSHGKSAIYRALNWLYDNAGQNPRQYIKKGATHAKVTVELTNGFRISRIVESKRSGKNGFEVYNPHTNELVETNTKGIDEVRALLGFHKVPLDGGKELDINFMGQGESWFFIGKHVTPSDRAKMIGSIFGTHYTDAVLKDMEGTLKKTDTQVKGLKEQWEELDKEIEGYAYLNTVESRLSEATTRLQKLNGLIERKATLIRLKEKQESLQVEEKKWQAALDSVVQIDQARMIYTQLIATQTKKDILSRHVVVLLRIGRETKGCQETLKSVRHINQAVKQLETVKAIHAKREQLVMDVKRYTETNNRLSLQNEQIELQKKQLKATEHLADASQKVLAVKQNAERLAKMKGLYGRLTEHKERIGKGTEFLSQTEETLAATLDQYEHVLTHLGTCPTCHGTIDKAAVKLVVNSHR